MVTKISKLIIGLTLALVILWGLSKLIPTEEKRIQKQLLNLANLVTVTGKEGNITRVSSANALGNAFTVDAEVSLENSGVGISTIQGRGEIQQMALTIMNTGRGVTVELADVMVRVAPDRQTATADLTAKVTATGERDFGLPELRFQLRKVEARWLITRVESRKTFGQ